jgi:hypothetical protein
MIQMRMSEQDGIEVAGEQPGRKNIFGVVIRAALEHAEVHQHAGAVGFNEVGRSGDFARGPMYCDFQARLSLNAGWRSYRQLI